MYTVSCAVYVAVLLINVSLCVRITGRDIVRGREDRTCCAAVADETLKIDFRNSDSGNFYTLLIWKALSALLWNSTSGEQVFGPHEVQMRDTTCNETCWILQYDCFLAQPGHRVNVSVYRQNDMLTSATNIVKHISTDKPGKSVPKANITVDILTKYFTVKMEAEQTVKLSLCYKRLHTECNQFNYFGVIDPRVNQTVNLSFPNLLPCVCVQLWYTGTDTRRNTQCPLNKTVLPHGGDILSSSSARVLGSYLHWEPVCATDQSNLTISLCWLFPEQKSHCVPVSNSTLSGTDLKYDVSAVDKHPQMCVKFSLNGSNQIFCPFMSEETSEWSVTVVPGSLHLHVHLTSDVVACFAAQLCTRERGRCVPQGSVLSCRVDVGATEAELKVPVPSLPSGLCVQVWRVDLLGKRIICPDYTHRRWGLVLGSALTLLAAVVLLLCFTCYLMKRTMSVWRCAKRRPLLLVCSSDDTAHITAVCSLASGLQGELFMDVRLAQWAHCRSQSSLAQLGPQPWLYGQCQAVQKAGGIILIVWSLDAHHAYLRWRNHSSINKKWESDVCNTGRCGVKGWCDGQEKKYYDGEWMEKPRNSSSITVPVFNAALSCLWTGIQSDGQGRGFGLVCFQGLNSSSYIPKQLRCVQTYRLPRDLSSLIHELGSSWDGIEKNKGSRQCWPRLLSKALSFFVSRQLVSRLEVGLPVSDRCSTKLLPKVSWKIKSATKKKTLKQKKSQSKVLTKTGCKKKSPAAELPQAHL